MPPQKIFLSAQWKNLLIANFICDEKVLLPYLPAHTELDIFEGNNLISLVAFQFLETKVMGIKFPFHTNFVEVNLRFYVRHKENNVWHRGVVFISEIVPRFMISFIANTLFKENYSTSPTAFELQKTEQGLDLRYSWGKHNYFQATAENTSKPLGLNSLEEFITEHYRGYAKAGSAAAMQYTVEHPHWEIFPIRSYNLTCDFTKLYGKNFSFLQNMAPHSILWAAGSDILVRKGTKILN